MGTHLRVTSESYPMSTNMTGFRWFFKNICVIVLRTIVASALEWVKRTAFILKIWNFDNPHFSVILW